MSNLTSAYITVDLSESVDQFRRPDVPLVSLAIPFYNESATIDRFFNAVLPALAAIPQIRFEIVCVNDGSADTTLAQLIDWATRLPCIRVFDLTRNFGKEAALSAAIDGTIGDIIIPFDADLQDPPQVISALIEKWREGYDVVLAKRGSRVGDSHFKRWTAMLFYRLHNKISDLRIPENVGDFRLMSREVVTSLKSLTETRRFMKGLFAGSSSFRVDSNNLIALLPG